MKRVSLAELPREGVSHDPQIMKQVMLRRGDVPHVTAFSRSTLAPGQAARAHQHYDMCEVFFVESGVGVMKIEGTEHQLERGVCVAVEPGELHEITNNSSSDLVLIYFGLEA
ncbi:MAG TPA: cupin domain-containing protein [Chthoniobacterales bacterium]|nr:cupin domain-containing protein [Chthoniobacterales bacterium]